MASTQPNHHAETGVARSLPPQRPSDSSQDEELIEGGRITLSSDEISWKDRHETETAKVLAFVLVGTMVLSLGLHYMCVTILMLNGKKEAVEVLTSVFDKWLPVISSFVGGAVTFYLTRRKG